MTKRLIRSLLVLLMLAAGYPAIARDYTLGTLRIDHPWARASIGKAKAGAAYLTVSTSGETADRLIGVASPVARHVALHTHLMQDGVMKMRPVQAIEIAPGEPTVLRPGGLHVMLMGLKAPLVEGELFPLVLTFEKSGSIEVEVLVREPSAMVAPSGRGHGS